MISFLKKNKSSANKSDSDHSANQDQRITTSLNQNLQEIQKTLGHSWDIMFKDISWGNLQASLIYTEGLSEQQTIQVFLESFYSRLQGIDLDPNTITSQDFMGILKVTMTTGTIKAVAEFERLYNALLSGESLLLVDGLDYGYVIPSKGKEERSVEESKVQTVIRGPRDSFTESITTNLSLIRRRIKAPSLWVESKKIGQYTGTDVAIMYIKGVANDKVVKEVHERLDRIDVDGILESGYIEECIQDSVYSPFPTIFNSDRPDIISAGLLEGRIAIIIDGTPVVLLVPVMFVSFMQSAEDYYNRSDFGLIRLLRYIALFISLFGPGLYIAITTFHQEMLPTTLLTSLASQREGVPFPAFVEAFVMEITFELLREAGVRMPRQIGPSISIVGAFILGTAAVEAGFISSAIVIIVSITAIATLVIPSYSFAISVRMLRFGIMIGGAVLGLYGIFIVWIIIVLHLCTLRSFGIPYMSPMAPFVLPDQKDAIFRFPLWTIRTRPRFISQNNVIREQTPSPKTSEQQKSPNPNKRDKL